MDYQGIDSLLINGLRLPNEILKRLKNGTWVPPEDKAPLKLLIDEKNPIDKEICWKITTQMINGLHLYTPQLMQGESATLTKEIHIAERAMFLGKEDPNIFPGKVNPEKTIFFADFGIGYDTPIALDYQENEYDPSVILLYWAKEPSENNRWKEIASSFAEFESIIWQ